MGYPNERLNDIFDRTSGRCHICHRSLRFANYNRFSRPGAWEVEHSVAWVQGGSDRLGNLYAACISCNRSKGTRSSRSVRAECGQRKAPLSTVRRRQAKDRQAVAGAALFGLAGAAFGPAGAILGAVVGALFGDSQDPDSR